MGKIGSFLHTSKITDDVLNCDTSYNVARVHTHQLYGGNSETFQDRIESVAVRFTSIAGATSVTVRLCWDAAGDYTIIPDTTATLSTGITTGTSGCTTIYFGAPLKNTMNSNDVVYLFVKLDAGTATLDESSITWSE